MGSVRRLASFRHRWFRSVIAACGLFVSLAAAFAPSSEAADLKVGDATLTVDEGVELGFRERTVKKLPRGTEIVVTEVRDPWIGGETKIDRGFLEKHGYARND